MNRLATVSILGLIAVGVTGEALSRQRRPAPAFKPPAVSTAGGQKPANVQAARSEWNRARPLSPTQLTPREMHALAAIRGRGSVAPLGAVPQGSTSYLVYNLEFKDADSCKELKVDGVTVFNRLDRFADVFVATDVYNEAVKAIQAAKGYVWHELTSAVHAPPPEIGKKAASRATPEQIVRGGIGDLKGQGVIIAVIDTGLDFRNPDFVTYDKDGVPTSRLRWFWDTGSDNYAEGGIGAKAPVSYPNGRSIGKLYSRDDLNQELRSPKALVPVWDIDGHGTSCAGVAAGNGNSLNGRYAGVAPEAELIGVRLGDSLESAYLLNAICGWLDEAAGKTPLVISCSFGSRDSSHDGSRIEERQLNARFPLSAKGRLLCIAAGNDGGSNLHAELGFGGKDKPGSLRWSTPTDGYMTIYYDIADEKDLRYSSVGPVTAQETGSVNPITGKYVSFLTLSPGQGELQLYSDSGKKIEADAYLSGSGASSGARFDDSCAAFNKSIASPGSAHNAITVGSYDWNDQFEQYGKLGAFTDPIKDAPLTIGALSGYSGTGPLRGVNVVKPDIVAPGQYYAASASRNTKSVRDTTGRYRLFNGTSAATPYTAGVLALVLQKKPTLTLGEVKELLKKCGSQDRFTGPLPNPKWGYGKLDLKATEKMLDELK